MLKQTAKVEKRLLPVSKEDEGKRLDLFLSFHNNDWSRSFIKKQIESNAVTVNGNVEFKANYKVRQGDKIEIVAKIERPSLEIIPEKIELEVIHEDKDLIVINKPAGMPVHPATGNWTGTLMNALVGYMDGLKEVGDKARSGLIHRLDKDTSGVIMIAKNNEALWYYSKLFSEKKVVKNYYAIVSGDIFKIIKGDKFIVLRNYIGRNPKDRKKFAVVQKDGRMAVSKIIPLKSFGEVNSYSLVLVKPETGRTHQIRVHLAFLGFPIIGDKIYGRQSFERMMLHASSIELTMRDGKMQKFNAGIPMDFLTFIASQDGSIDFKTLFKDVSEKEEEAKT